MSTPRHGHALLLLAAALLTAAAAAQAPNDEYTSGQQVRVSTSMIALLAAVIAVFVFIACSTIYLRHCTGGYYDDGAGSSGFHDGRNMVLDRTAFTALSRRQRRPRGLDADVVRAFPTMKYAEAKAMRVGTNKGNDAALECAVCLSEFDDEDRLMLLPRCSHAFHPDCIGEWLAGHVTCPVCRCNLDPNHKPDTASSDEHPRVPLPAPHQAGSVVSSEETSLRQDDGALAAAVVTDVVTEEEEERLREAIELQQIGNQRRAMRRSRLARSHSTGHSLAVRLDRDLDRFTLRLPDHVRREMVAASEHSLQLRRARGVVAGGEGSSRGGRSGPLGRAARWQSLLARTFSGKVSFFSASRITVSSDGSGGGEVSSTSSSRVRGKRVAAVDAAGVPVTGGLIRLDRMGGSPSSARAGTVLPNEAAPARDAEKKKPVTQQVRT